MVDWRIRNVRVCIVVVSESFKYPVLCDLHVVTSHQMSPDSLWVSLVYRRSIVVSPLESGSHVQSNIPTLWCNLYVLFLQLDKTLPVLVSVPPKIPHPMIPHLVFTPPLTLPHPMIHHLDFTPPLILPHPWFYSTLDFTPLLILPHLRFYPTVDFTPPLDLPHPWFYPTLYFTPLLILPHP